MMGVSMQRNRIFHEYAASKSQCRPLYVKVLQGNTPLTPPSLNIVTFERCFTILHISAGTFPMRNGSRNAQRSRCLPKVCVYLRHGETNGCIIETGVEAIRKFIKAYRGLTKQTPRHAQISPDSFSGRRVVSSCDGGNIVGGKP